MRCVLLVCALQLAASALGSLRVLKCRLKSALASVFSECELSLTSFLQAH